MHNTTQAKLVSCSRHDVKQKRKELIDDGEKTQKWQSWNTNRFTIVGIKMPSPFPIKKYIIKKCVSGYEVWNTMHLHVYFTQENINCRYKEKYCYFSLRQDTGRIKELKWISPTCRTNCDRLRIVIQFWSTEGCHIVYKSYSYDIISCNVKLKSTVTNKELGLIGVYFYSTTKGA